MAQALLGSTKHYWMAVKPWRMNTILNDQTERNGEHVLKRGIHQVRSSIDGENYYLRTFKSPDSS